MDPDDSIGYRHVRTLFRRLPENKPVTMDKLGTQPNPWVLDFWITTEHTSGGVRNTRFPGLYWREVRIYI